VQGYDVESVIDVLMFYRQTYLSVSALLCTENLVHEFNHSISKSHVESRLLFDQIHNLLAQICTSL
jgi:hypothetical protein